MNKDGREYVRWRAGKHFAPQSEKLADIDELQRFAEFGRISARFLHEFANPLSAAALHIELCDSNSHEALKEVRKNIVLLEKYMKAARSQLKRESCRSSFIIQREVRRSLLLLGPLAKKSGVKIKISALPQTLTIQGDAVKFNQIFANLVANAIDAYAGIESLQKIVNVQYRVRGRFLHIYVNDMGKGIPANEIPTLFKPFYTTTNKAGRGLGLGLSMVKRMVEEDFSGYIYATSTKSKGTTFSVKLMMQPIAQPIPGTTLRRKVR